jgi:uncharacterized protein YbaR (Trm112 family)
MADISALRNWVVCPLCRGDLAALKDALFCVACDRRFASVGGVPCLLTDLNARRAEWVTRVLMLKQATRATLTLLSRELKQPDLLAATRERLRHQAALTVRMSSEACALLEEATGTPVIGSADAAPFAELPGAAPQLTRSGPFDAFHLLHRDWGWPTSENARALALLERVLTPPLGPTLVLGAGAGRLAYDLNLHFGAVPTLALDVDPIALLVASRMARGESVELTEGWAGAPELSRISVTRALSAPEGSAPNLHFVLADGLAPPCQEHAFQTVVTPWFIDVVPPDARAFLNVVQRYVAPGGRWVHVGPLLYPPERPLALRYTMDELIEAAAGLGLSFERQHSEVLPYSVSPLTGRGKLELCFALACQAEASVREQRPPLDSMKGGREIAP